MKRSKELLHFAAGLADADLWLEKFILDRETLTIHPIAFMIGDSVVAVPCNETTCQDYHFAFPVKGGNDGRKAVCSTQKVKAVLVFLG